MGFLKRLFVGDKISDDEMQRRMGKQAPELKKEPEESYSEMTDEEKLQVWSEIRELEQLDVKMDRMQKLAESGFPIASLDMFNFYNDKYDLTGEFEWDQLEYWAKKAADYGLPKGYYDLGLVYTSGKNPNWSWERMEEGLRAYIKALEYADSIAASSLKDFWDLGADSSDEKMQLARANMHQLYDKIFSEELPRLENEENKNGYSALGLLYYYGIFVNRDLQKALYYFNQINKDELPYPIEDILDTLQSDDEDDD